MSKKFLSTFYNPNYKGVTKEERFLLNRRIRLIERIEKVKQSNDKWKFEKEQSLNKKLKETELKLGCYSEQ